MFFLICILDTLHKLSSTEKAGIVEKNGQATPNQNTEYTCTDGRQIHFFVSTKPFHNKQIYKWNSFAALHATLQYTSRAVNKYIWGGVQFMLFLITNWKCTVFSPLQLITLWINNYASSHSKWVQIHSVYFVPNFQAVFIKL